MNYRTATLLESVRFELEEKSSVPRPPGKGWFMVFGKWRQIGGMKRKAKAAIKDKIVGTAKSIKALPKGAAKLVANKEFRKEVGAKASKSLRSKAAHALGTIKHEVKEFKMAGKAVAKLARRESISSHEKKAIKAVVKAVAMTVAGTLVMGGIAHLTAGALAQHFAAETAIKSVGKAALLAHLIYEASDESAFDEWVKSLIQDIADRVEKLGDMSEDDIAAILQKSPQ